MSENPLSIRAKIAEIELYDEGLKETLDDDRAGHIDVRYWLERGDVNLGVADVRIYFRRTDASLDELTTSALVHGHQILSQIAQHYRPDPSDTSPEQLWIQ